MGPEGADGVGLGSGIANSKGTGQAGLLLNGRFIGGAVLCRPIGLGYGARVPGLGVVIWLDSRIWAEVLVGCALHRGWKMPPLSGSVVRRRRAEASVPYQQNSRRALPPPGEEERGRPCRRLVWASSRLHGGGSERKNWGDGKDVWCGIHAFTPANSGQLRLTPIKPGQAGRNEGVCTNNYV